MGRSPLNFADVGSPNWSSSSKDSTRMAPLSPKRGYSSPSQLARSLSLKRANARAQHLRSENNDPQPSLRKSQFRRALSTLDNIIELGEGIQARSMEKNAGINAKELEKKYAEVNAVLQRKEEELWDQEFSSMSSYGSDLMNRSFNFGETDQGDIIFTDECSSSNLMSETDLGAGSSEEIEDGSNGDDGFDFRKKNWAKQRRMRNRESISSFLPSDLCGSVADSVALAKDSSDPYADFKDSIKEMMEGHNLRNWSDLEELLYCYLSLNSPEFHPQIEQAFSDVLLGLLQQNEIELGL